MQYRFGPFRLDPLKRRLWRGDEIVSLTPKAFDTLLVLVERAGKVVEKDEVLKAVWPGTFIEEATLAQNISTLRKALGDTSENPRYIATSPRRGYRFIETVGVDDEKSETPSDAAPATLTHRTSGKRFWIALAGVLLLNATALLVWQRRPTPSAATPVVFTVTAPEGTELSNSGGLLAVSPNGRHIAFVASGADGVDALWIREVDSVRARRLPGTDDAAQPFWSPDSRFVAFFSTGKLRRIGVAGESLKTICDAPAGSQSLAGTWNDQDEILFATVRQGIHRVQAMGGVATALSMPAVAEADVARWPQFLPDARHFLYTVRHADADRSGIFVGSLDGAEATRLLPHASSAGYAPPGYVLYVERGILWARAFDSVRLRLVGEPVQIAEDVAFNAGTGRGTFSTSQTGVLAYRVNPESQLTWFDRAGNSLGPIGPVAKYSQFSISPDDSKIAVARLDAMTATSEIWVFTATTNDAARLTFNGSFDRQPIWSRDGTRIIFASNRDGPWAIYEKDVTGVAAERRLFARITGSGPQHVTSDGQVLIQRWNPVTYGDFWLVPLASSQTPIQLQSLDVNEREGRISPDGRWLAYEADEVFVRAIDSLASRWQISRNRGHEPRWRKDGKELFHLSRELAMMTSEIQPGAMFHTQPARTLFQTRAVVPTGLTGQAYDVTSDGQRFLIKVPAAPSPITVIVNWLSMVRSRPST